jgi:hypothetical protein
VSTEGALQALIVAAQKMLRLDLLDDLQKAHALVELERTLIEAGKALRAGQS